MSHYLYDNSEPISGALAALALVFAFLGWMKARATHRQLEFVLQELNRRTAPPTPDEVAKAVMRRMAAQQKTSDMPHPHDDHTPRPRDPYNKLADLAPAVGTAKFVERPAAVDETRVQRSIPDPRRAPAYAEPSRMSMDDDRELPRFDPYQGVGGDYGSRTGAFSPQRASYLEPAMG